jgi:hypothetical protein
MTIGKTIVATLEDPHRDTKVAGITRIPAGTYILGLRTDGGMTKEYADKYGDNHQGMLWLQDVPGFTFVYIHVGNFAADTDGCILVGMSAAQNHIRESRKAYELIYPLLVDQINNGGCAVTIIDEEE